MTAVYMYDGVIQVFPVCEKNASKGLRFVLSKGGIRKNL
jgi:hypothetical protein